MPRSLLLFYLFVLCTTALSQVRKPIYRSKADSVHLATIQKSIQDFTVTKSMTASTYDSLVKLESRLREEVITGYRFIFLPNEKFTSLDDLLSEKIRPSEVTRLSIHRYPHTRIPGLVRKCTHLNELELVESSIHKLPRWLRKLSNLKTIHIYNIHPGRPIVLAKNPVITKLRIRGVGPGNVPRNFARLRSLDTLDLQGNNLSEFPDLGRNQKLQQLLLTDNNLTLDHFKTSPLPSLKHLSLQKNKIKRVPGELAKFTHLKKLVLNYNEIDSIDLQLGLLDSLEELALYSNKLQSVPMAIYELPQLKFIDLYFNSIEKIDDRIARMKSLEILYLASNRIFMISDRIGELNNLTELYLHHNRISYLPSSLRNLHQLNTLRFNANHMVDIPVWISELKNLKNLDFSQNKISETPWMLKELRHLELLSMTENPWDDEAQMENLAEELSRRGVIVNLD